MVKRGGFPFIVQLLAPAFLVLLLSGCPNPFEVKDNASRDLDRPLPVAAELDEPQLDDAYDTQPVWTWTGDSVEGVQIFRVRLNGGDWRIPDPPSSTSYSIADETDEAGNPRHLFPGRYVFEVQERNVAGNWSNSAEINTTILVREPVFAAGGVPGAYTSNRTPSFTWEQWRGGDPPQPQFGAANVFSWTLERQVNGGWTAVAGESASDRPDVTSYTVGSPLEEGVHRFGVLENNQGGEQSAYRWTQFTVDTTPPLPPVITGPVAIGSSNPDPVTYSWDFDTSDTLGEFLWRLEDESGNQLDALGNVIGGDTVNSTGTVPELSVNLSTLGVYTLSVTHVDLAGNSAISTFVFAVEDIPTVTYTGPDPTNNQTPLVSIIGTDPGNLINEFQWVIDGTPVNDPGTGGTFAAPVGMSTPFDRATPVLAEGFRQIQVRQARDAGSGGGFTSPSAPVEIEIDITPPPVPTGVSSGDLLFDTEGDLYTLNDDPVFSWAVSEPGATYQYSRDGITWDDVGPATSANIGLLTPGNYWFSVRATDVAGNTSLPSAAVLFRFIESASATITITNPSVPVFSMSPGTFTLDVGGPGPEQQEISIATSETIDSYRWFINGLELAGETGPTLTVLAAWAVDGGNPTILGSNTLTLVVEIGGMPWSDDFFFTVEDN